MKLCRFLYWLASGLIGLVWKCFGMLDVVKLCRFWFLLQWDFMQVAWAGCVLPVVVPAWLASCLLASLGSVILLHFNFGLATALLYLCSVWKCLDSSSCLKLLGCVSACAGLMKLAVYGAAVAASWNCSSFFTLLFSSFALLCHLDDVNMWTMVGL